MSERVLLCGAWDEGAGYPRTRSLRAGLLGAGAEVHECRVDGMGRDKQAIARAPWRWPGAVLQQRRRRAQLLARLDAELRRARPDVVLVPYPGHGLVAPIRARVDAPVVFDMFLSAYDTVVEDRALVRPGSLLARYLQDVDTRACAAADLVVLDTPENAAYAQALTGLPAERFTWLPVHDPDAPSRAAPYVAPRGDEPLRLLFFGTGVPLHGLRTLVRAVARTARVAMTIVGGTDDDRRFAAEVLGDRATIADPFVDRARLQALLDESHLVAGVFGAGGKAQRVVPFKVVHALAAGRPVVTADTPAIAGWLEGSGAVTVVDAAEPRALAEKLDALAADPGALAAAAAAARPAYERHFGTARLASRCRALLDRVSSTPTAEVA